MGWAFNPPPNWPPPPPGWVPPPGWQPDPSWGPPPEGHEFWVDDSGDGELAVANGLAVTALVLAAASLLLSWLPIINNGIFFSALFALVLAVPAAVMTWSKSGPGRVMALAAGVLAVIAMTAVLISQAFYASLFT